MSISISIFILFLLSGFAALVFEISWVRLLGLVLGSSMQAVSCVIGCFLGGLAIGAFLGGKLSDRIRHRHLLVYAAIETSAGLTGLAVTYLLLLLPELFARWQVAGSSSATPGLSQPLLISGFLLLPPTILMGMTLPLLSRFISQVGTYRKHFFAWLYGVNTMGAVLGSLFAGFVAFPYLGVRGTTHVAVGIYVAIGLVALVLSSSTRSIKFDSRPASPSEDLQSNGCSADASRLTQRTYKSLLAIGFLCGLTSISYEVLWTRLLHSFMDSSTYAFTLMVCNFLLGLVLGTILYTQAIKTHADWRNRLRLLGFIQLAIVLVSLVGYLLLPGALFAKAYAIASFTPSRMLIADMVASSAFMLPIATLLGVCLPLITEVALLYTNLIGQRVGTVYAFNTFGAILGSITCGLLLIPAYGSHAAFEITVTLTLLIAIVCLAAFEKPVRAIACAVLPTVALISFVLLVPRDYLNINFARLHTCKFVVGAEDAVSKVLVMANENSQTRRLIVNGGLYSSDRPSALRYMRTLGELPALLCPNPKRALVICFGVGNTAHMLDANRDIEHLDICELSKAVIDCEPQFSALNHNVLQSKKTHLAIADGRNLLLRSANMYDIITLEPPPPQDAGVVNLYTREFYRLAAHHLSANGKLCQWIPLHCVQAGLVKQAIQAGRAEFRYTTFWIPNGGDGVLICSQEPITFDCSALQQRINSHPLEKQCLAEVGLDDACHILSTLVLAGPSMESYVQQCSPISDDRPQLEFFLADKTQNEQPDNLALLRDRVGIAGGITMQNYDQRQLELNRQAMHLLYRKYSATDMKTALDAARGAKKLLGTNLFVDWTLKHPLLN
jgi:predicted membrane-bound spermidine synthase